MNLVDNAGSHRVSELDHNVRFRRNVRCLERIHGKG